MLIITIVSIIIVAAIAAIIFLAVRNTSSSQSLINKDYFATLTKQENEKISTMRLANGLTPPTNKWFSGIALQETPKTVFPTPLAFTPTDTGFNFGLTGVEASANVIIASNRNEVQVEIASADSYRVTRYDELSVDLTYYTESGDSIAVLTIASGSPYIFIKPLGGTVSLSTTQQYAMSNGRHNYITDKAHYAISGVDGGAKSLTIKGDVASFYAAPNGEAIAALSEYAGNKISNVAVEYEQTEDSIKTLLTVTTENKGRTILGSLPHNGFKGTSLFTTETIYGTEKFYSGSQFSFETEKITTSTGELKLDSLTSSEREELITMLRREINATDFKAIDTYFGGKELYRASQLLQLAEQLEQPQIASTIKQKLLNEFRTWFSPKDNRTSKYFYYDTKLKSLIGAEASFGSDEANDHHFHYGYFIYAASILARYDTEFLEEYKDSINLLVAEIANYNTGENLPLRRYFDPYFGHSWASGTSPFDDGNNQESTSEAINAWVGVSLWAQTTKNNTLASEAHWLISQEVNATQAYWLSNPQASEGSAYQHTIFSLNWGGKREYSTFFTAEPAAKLGILLIPLNPTLQASNVLARDAITQQLAEASAPTSTIAYNFQDYLLMYGAYQDTQKALNDVRAFNTSAIDGANSQSYMFAWVVSLR